MAFMTTITGTGGQPELNFANQGNGCTVYSGTNLFHCADLALACPKLSSNRADAFSGLTFHLAKAKAKPSCYPSVALLTPKVAFPPLMKPPPRRTSFGQLLAPSSLARRHTDLSMMLLSTASISTSSLVFLTWFPLPTASGQI